MFKRRGFKRQPSVAGVRHLFHGVSVKAGQGYCCSAVVTLGDERFLSDEAPELPLSGCEMPQQCRCVYTHFDDRRTQTRRESDMGLPDRGYDLERRMQVHRRITDG